jgi:hypothetical protein
MGCHSIKFGSGNAYFLLASSKNALKKANNVTPACDSMVSSVNMDSIKIVIKTKYWYSRYLR